jgi:hypothetical protein
MDCASVGARPVSSQRATVVFWSCTISHRLLCFATTKVLAREQPTDEAAHVESIPAAAQPGGMRFDGVEFLRADTHRGWGIASMARGAARWARFS